MIIIFLKKNNAPHTHPRILVVNTDMPTTTVTVTSIRLVGTWHRELPFDTCSICKESINDAAPLARADDTGELDHFSEAASGHTLRIGACGHVFHTCCLERWLDRRAVCPLCNAAWVTARECM